MSERAEIAWIVADVLVILISIFACVAVYRQGRMLDKIIDDFKRKTGG